MTPRPPSPKGLSLSDRLTLIAVLLVVVVVSLPRLRSFGLRDNEAEALHALEELGRVVHAAERNGPQIDLLDLAREDARLERRLRGARPLGQIPGPDALPGSPRDGGAQPGCFLLHGYLFEWRRTAASPVLLAWPWNVGATGRGAFACPADGQLYGHANREGLWTGPQSPPSWPLPEGEWRLLAVPADL